MKRLFAGLLIGLTIISCEKEGVSRPKQLLPLKDGNQWRYQVYENGKLTDTIQMKVAKNGKTDIGGAMIDSYKLYSSPLSAQSIEYGSLFSNDETEGLVQIGIFSKDENLIMPSLYFKYPVREGAIWEYKHLVFSRNEDETNVGLEFRGIETMECLDADYEISYDGKKYKSIVFRDNFSPYDDETWARLTYIVPGIGIVKTEHFVNESLYREMVLYRCFLQ